MMNEMISNCIIYVTGMVPGILCAGACIGAAVTILARAIGVPLAAGTTRLPRVIAWVIRVLLFLLALLPPTLTGMTIRRLLRAELPAMIRIRHLFPALNPITVSSTLGALVVSTPILILFAAAALHHVNPETVLAAQTLGMKRSVIRKRVILPQARTGILTGTVLCYARALGESTATAAVLADPVMLEGRMVSAFTTSILTGTYVMACLWIVGWLLAGGLVLLCYSLCCRRRTASYRTH